eukprot:15546_1
MFKSVGRKSSKFLFEITVHSVSDLQGFDSSDPICLVCTRKRKSYRTHVVLRGEYDELKFGETIRFFSTLFKKKNSFSGKKFNLRLSCDTKKKKRNKTAFVGEIDLSEFVSEGEESVPVTLNLTRQNKKQSDGIARLKLTVTARWQKDYAEGEGSDVSSVHSFSSFGSGMESMDTYSTYSKSLGSHDGDRVDDAISFSEQPESLSAANKPTLLVVPGNGGTASSARCSLKSPTSLQSYGLSPDREKQKDEQEEVEAERIRTESSPLASLRSFQYDEE